jgi:hypothetical protein
LSPSAYPELAPPRVSAPRGRPSFSIRPAQRNSLAGNRASLRNVQAVMCRSAFATLLALVFAGCSAPPPDPSVGLSMAATPTAATSLPDEVLLLRAWSGPWDDPGERVGRVRAVIVLYRDGLIVADVSPVGDRQDFRATQLGPAELANLRARLANVAPIPFERASSRNSGCADCTVQVIQVRDGDRVTEIAVYGFSTEINVVPEGTPVSAVKLSELLDELGDIVAAHPPVGFDRPIPVVPAAPQVGG